MVRRCWTAAWAAVQALSLLFMAPAAGRAAQEPPAAEPPGITVLTPPELDTALLTERNEPGVEVVPPYALPSVAELLPPAHIRLEEEFGNQWVGVWHRLLLADHPQSTRGVYYELSDEFRLGLREEDPENRDLLMLERVFEF